MKKSYDHQSVANIDTCFAPNILGRGCFISLWRPVRTASALSGLLVRCLASKMEDAIISSAHRCCPARVVRYCVAGIDSRTACSIAIPFMARKIKWYRRELRLARYGFGLRVDSGFRVYAGAFYAAQRRHPAAREKTLNPKLDTNHSLGRDPKVRALRVSGRAKARASRVAFEKNLPTWKMPKTSPGPARTFVPSVTF